MTRISLILFWIIILLLEVVAHFWFIVCVVFNPSRAVEIVLGYDRLGNIVMGQGNETISSWTGRNNGWMEPYINKMFEWLGQGKNHCDSNKEFVG